MNSKKYNIIYTDPPWSCEIDDIRNNLQKLMDDLW